MKTVNYKNLMALGFPEHNSRDIIRQARRIAIERFNESFKAKGNVIELEHTHLVRSPFDNRSLGIAPTEIVEELIGLSLTLKYESEKKNE